MVTANLAHFIERTATALLDKIIVILRRVIRFIGHRSQEKIHIFFPQSASPSLVRKLGKMRVALTTASALLLAATPSWGKAKSSSSVSNGQRHEDDRMLTHHLLGKHGLIVAKISTRKQEAEVASDQEPDVGILSHRSMQALNGTAAELCSDTGAIENVICDCSGFVNGVGPITCDYTSCDSQGVCNEVKYDIEYYDDGSVKLAYCYGNTVAAYECLDSICYAAYYNADQTQQNRCGIGLNGVWCQGCTQQMFANGTVAAVSLDCSNLVDGLTGPVDDLPTFLLQNPQALCDVGVPVAPSAAPHSASPPTEVQQPTSPSSDGSRIAYTRNAALASLAFAFALV
jgi:hypothetical protein